MNFPKLILFFILALSTIVHTPGCSGEEEPMQAQIPPLTLSVIRDVSADSLHGDVTVYFSPGYRERAVELHTMIEEAVAFFEDSLSLRTEVNLVVLSPDHWQQLTPLFYGVPFASPEARAIILPAADGAITDIFQSLYPLYPGERVDRIKAAGFSFDDGVRKKVDLIGFHELGHLLVHPYGIATASPWLNEFLATYFSYTFMSTNYPHLADMYMAFAVFPPSYQPGYTSLDDFNDHYTGVGFENYGWYQGIFAAKASEVFAQRGPGFLADVRDAFPEESENLSGAEVLTRLDYIYPGFTEWAEEIGYVAN
jgi:hypothetical protein